MISEYYPSFPTQVFLNAYEVFLNDKDRQYQNGDARVADDVDIYLSTIIQNFQMEK